jgi:hypothetical protein
MPTELAYRLLAILVAVRRFTSMGVAYSRSLHFDSYVRMQHFVRRSPFVPFQHFLGDVHREFMQRLSAALHRTLGSCFRNALQEGSADVVVCLHVPRAWMLSSFLLLAWWSPLFFLVRILLDLIRFETENHMSVK